MQTPQPALLLVVLLMGLSVPARGAGDKRSVGAEAEAKRRQSQVRAEVGALGPAHAWAGDYYAGDGLGANTTLLLAPAAGFVFEWHGCLGLYDRNYGAVAWAGDRVRLTFTFPNQRKGFQGIAPEFVPVAWGERRYLVAADELMGFCNAVNSGDEPRRDLHGRHLLRRGDEKKPARGQPALPAEFGRHLLAEPLTATIVAVGASTTRPSVVEWRFRDTPVTLDVGARQGVAVGMKLLVVAPEDVAESVRVTRVEEDRAEALMTQAGEEEPGPQVGWRLSTRAPWNAPAAR